MKVDKTSFNDQSYIDENSGNYQQFIANIKKGNFVLPYCRYCKKNIWPPVDYCIKCFNKLELINLQNEKGKLIDIFHSYMNIEKKMIKENSNSDITNEDVIALVEFNGVKLLGSIDIKKRDDPFRTNVTKKTNMTKCEEKSQDSQITYVKIKKCGFSCDKIFYKFKPVKK